MMMNPKPSRRLAAPQLPNRITSEARYASRCESCRLFNGLFAVLLLSMLALAITSRFCDSLASAAEGAPEEWPAYGRDAGGMRYAPLDQINRDNVAKLEVAWTFHTGELEKLKGTRLESRAAFEATPIMIDGTLYFSTPSNRVFAIDAASGEKRWTFDPDLDLSRGYSEGASRGVSVWTDSKKSESEPERRRIFLGTLDARLIALDAGTGAPCKDFGENGTVRLMDGAARATPGNYVVTSPPAVIGDIVVVGSAIGDNSSVETASGVVRAFNARNGEMVWDWNPIPQKPSDPGWATWQGTKAHKTGAANVWSIISADVERDLVFLPTSCPSPDYFGGERLGENLYANSVVALRASTGEKVWHYQVVHHDIWDYDVAAQPMLFTLKRDGQALPAVAVGTKMGFIFVLNRETGEPLLPVEERPVPSSDVPGEVAAETQPFPATLPALGLHDVAAEDIWGLTEKEQNWAHERAAPLRYEGMYTPPSLAGTLISPSNVGGLNWSGMAFDPDRQLLVTNVNRLAAIVRLIPRDEYQQKSGERMRTEFAPQRGTPYGMAREIFRAPSGLPATAPPWGTLAAIDLTSGELRWEVPLGYVPQLSIHPQAEEWGSPNLGGAIITAGGLVFVAGSMDGHLRAFDVESGTELWRGKLPAGGQATPMTYQVEKGGKQFVVIAAGGHARMGTTMGDAVVAFALPSSMRVVDSGHD